MTLIRSASTSYSLLWGNENSSACAGINNVNNIPDGSRSNANRLMVVRVVYPPTCALPHDVLGCVPFHVPGPRPVRLRCECTGIDRWRRRCDFRVPRMRWLLRNVLPCRWMELLAFVPKRVCLAYLTNYLQNHPNIANIIALQPQYGCPPSAR